MNPFFKACLITSILMNLNCANQRTPTGGPKDTIPPILTSSIPINETTLFNNDWIELSFDDDINTTTLKKNLVISPLTKLKYTVKTKKNIVRLTFENTLLDSTTYTFNFLDGVTDLTEKNPVVNLSLALSTGPYIDSLFITGYIHELYTQQPVGGVLVGLYLYSDSLDLTMHKPLYFNTTNDSGAYTIKNIKYGNYKVFAFNDENKNFSFDAGTEAYGLKSSFIRLSESMDSVNLIINTIDSRPLKLISSRPFGRYYNVRYTKPVTSYQISNLSSNKYTFLHQLSEDFTTIRIYPPLDSLYNPELDSNRIIISIRDTIQQQLSDTLTIKFLSSKREPAAPTSKINAVSIDEHQYRISLSFDKPIALVDTLKILLKTDSLIPYTPLKMEEFKWNFNKTALSFKVSIDWTAIQNSLNNELYKLNAIDSLIPNQRILNQTMIEFDSACFQDADGIALPKSLITLTKKTAEDFGTLNIKAATEKTSFIIQILNSKNNIIAERRNQKESTVPYIIPGIYKLRVLIDDNQDGVWTLGNFADDSTPETIYLYPSTTKISSNWEISIEDLSF